MGDRTRRNVLFFQQHAWTDSCAVRMCLPKSMCILDGSSLHHCKSPDRDSWLLDDVRLGCDSPLSPSRIVIIIVSLCPYTFSLWWKVDLEQFFKSEGRMRELSLNII